MPREGQNEDPCDKSCEYINLSAGSGAGRRSEECHGKVRMRTPATSRVNTSICPPHLAMNII